MAAFSLMGLAILAKGPVGLIIPMGIYLTGKLFSGKILRSLHRYFLWGVPLALMWPFAWLLCAKFLGNAPDAYFNELLFDQNVGRFQGTFGGHYKPFYYYLKYLPQDFLPWTFFFPATIFLLKKRPDLYRQSLTLAGWIGFVLVFFSLCSGKRNLYILSVYPAAALLTASVIPDMKTIPTRWCNAMVYPLLALLLILAAAGIAAHFLIPFSIPLYVFLPGSAAALAGAAILLIYFKKYGITSKWISIFIVTGSVMFFCTGTFVFQAFDPVKTPVALAVAVKENLPEDRNILYYRMNGEIQSLYSDRHGRRFDDIEALVATMKANGSGFLVGHEKFWEELRPVVGTWGERHEFTMGSKSLFWLEFMAPNQT
jgi:4-amino-4-deoxy-L-arabinose transferase-like glycosyltransferase